MSAHVPLTDAAVRTVAAEFGLGEVLAHEGPTGRGEAGFVVRFTTSTGLWAVKQLIEPQVEDQVREDVDLVGAARDAGVPTPAMRTTRAGTVLLDVDGQQVRVSEWVDLRDVDPMLDPASVGAALAALHRTAFAGSRGEDPWFRAAVGASRWDELLLALTAAGAGFADDLAAMRDELVALEELLVDPHDPRTCHRDLFPENLRGTASGSVCIIDWDGHGLAGASQELAMVVWGFAGGRADRAREIVESYAASGGTGRVRSAGDFTMLIAALAHINERACTRWLDHDTGDPERDRMAALFGESVADPLTRRTIEELLDAVG
jgi:tRNA A-37 threonylcarbamoyl transferase component Bud32